MFDINDVPLRLAQLRTQKNVSAREMSLAIGQNAGYIQNIECGKALPSLRVLFYICEYLEITPSAFFDDDAKDPVQLQALNMDLKKLNEGQLEIIHNVTKQMMNK